MTAGQQPQCATCLHRRSPMNRETPEGVTRSWCAAFPGGVVDAVWENRVDHREPVEGDHGVRWTPIDASTTFPAHLIQ